MSLTPGFQTVGNEAACLAQTHREKAQYSRMGGSLPTDISLVDRSSGGAARCEQDIEGGLWMNIVKLNLQNKTKQNKTKQNKTKQNKTKQNKTKQNKTKQNKTKQNKTKQNKTNRTEQNRTEQNITKQNKTKQQTEKYRRRRISSYFYHSESGQRSLFFVFVQFALRCFCCCCCCCCCCCFWVCFLLLLLLCFLFFSFPSFQFLSVSFRSCHPLIVWSTIVCTYFVLFLLEVFSTDGMQSCSFFNLESVSSPAARILSFVAGRPIFKSYCRHLQSCQRFTDS